MIEKLYKNGLEPINYVKAVTKNKCNRCFSDNLYTDEYGLVYCLDCYQYGEINETMNLYRFERDISFVKHEIKLTYTLTENQKKGSRFLLECFNNLESGFLQAVCGAGKTEMTYEVILEALNRNKRVCFIIPRVEVLKEVYKRFKSVFINTNISILYEGKKDFHDASLIFSTPQQLIVFYQEFDLIILDEVDAFPYSGNIFLERLVKKTLKSSGIILYMSATVSESFKNKANSIKKYLIPKRYHSRLLVVPEFLRIKQDILKTSKKYLNINNELSIQTIIFVPTINLADEYCRKLIKMGYSAANISSKTKYKSEVINQFRNENVKFLLATTVLERGVTFANIDVFVWFADHRVFNKETLIQISGRVGRDINYPNGKLLFFSEYISKAMKTAKKEIVYMNRMSKENEV